MTSTLPPLVQAISGALGSASANILTYPLDLVTTRVQLDPPVSSDNKRSIGVHRAVTILQQIIRKNGLGALYDGIWTDTGATILSNFLYFYFYSFLRSVYTRRPFRDSKGTLDKLTHKPSVFAELLLGFIAGVASRAISTPLNIVTFRLQTASHDDDEPETDNDESNPAIGVGSVVKAIYRQEGLTGFWRGFQTTVLLSLNPSLTLSLYQLFRRLLTFARNRSFSITQGVVSLGKGAVAATQTDPTPQEAFVGAAVSNSIAVMFLYPIILAKTRLQASSRVSLRRVIIDAYQGRNFAVRRGKSREGSISSPVGIKGLYPGLEMQIMKGFLSQGVTFLVKGRIEQIIVSAYLRRRQMR